MRPDASIFDVLDRRHGKNRREPPSGGCRRPIAPGKDSSPLPPWDPGFPGVFIALVQGIAMSRRWSVARRHTLTAFRQHPILPPHSFGPDEQRSFARRDCECRAARSTQSCPVKGVTAMSQQEPIRKPSDLRSADLERSHRRGFAHCGDGGSQRYWPRWPSSSLALRSK